VTEVMFILLPLFAVFLSIIASLLNYY